MQKNEELFTLCALLRPATKDELNVLREKILQDKISWVDTIALANSEYLIPALYANLEDKQLFEAIQDEELKEYLKEIFAFNTDRNFQILEQIKDFIAILKPLGISPLLLKGSAVLTEEDYASLGMRSLTDIDILIDDNDFQRSFEALQISGYGYVRSEDQHNLGKDFHHIEPIGKAGMPSSLELHRHILGKKASGYITYTSDKIQKSTNLIFQDAVILLPTYRIYHAFLHTEIQDDNHRLKYLALRHLFDFTVLAQKYYKDIDWKLLHQLAVSNNCKDILDDYLYTAKMLFALQTPLTIENRRTKRHYTMMLRSFELKGTFIGEFYPLPAKLHHIYAYERLQKRYHFNSTIGYWAAIVKHIIYQSNGYLFKKA